MTEPSIDTKRVSINATISVVASYLFMAYIKLDLYWLAGSTEDTRWLAFLMGATSFVLLGLITGYARR